MNSNNSMSDFASLLDRQLKAYKKGFNPGDNVAGRVMHIGSEFVTLDVNAKLAGLLPIEDVTDDDGEITVKKGDTLDLTFVTMKKDAFLFARADIAESAALVTTDATIQHAFDNGLTIEGKVEKEVKGGYEVTVAGQRGFCPYSQIDRFRKEGTVYEGQTLAFLVTEYSSDDRGMNLIVSHRKVVERELEMARDYLRDSLTEGQTINGTVAKVLNFGAFVDLGGVEGLVPVREISWDKVVDPNNFVKVGDAVTVKILSLDWDNNRISLSIRQCQAKPLKPRSPEEIAAEEEAVSAREWMQQNEKTNEGFSSLSSAFDGLKF